MTEISGRFNFRLKILDGADNAKALILIEKMHDALKEHIVQQGGSIDTDNFYPVEFRFEISYRKPTYSLLSDVSFYYTLLGVAVDHAVSRENS